MKTSEKLDSAYIETKRAQLLKLREQLQGATKRESTEKAALQQEYLDQALAYEDDSQSLELIQTSGDLLRHEVARLTQVHRALRKIEEGTYGYSDISGQRIATARLDALPEATTTLQEQQARE
jgi:DnaK suppressor protein